MRKKYSGKQMAKSSRFVERLALLEASQRKEVEEKIDVYVQENAP